MSELRKIIHGFSKLKFGIISTFVILLGFSLIFIPFKSTAQHRIAPVDSISSFHPHKISFSTGVGLRNDDLYPEFGLNYSYQISRGIAVVTQWTWLTKTDNHLLVIGTFIKPTKAFEFLVGIGQEFGRDEPENFVRIGLKYDIKTGSIYVSPMVSMDVFSPRRVFDQIQGEKAIHFELLISKPFGRKNRKLK